MIPIAPTLDQPTSKTKKSKKRIIESRDKKTKGSTGGEYVFGVQGFWVLAPSRSGAHSWEVRVRVRGKGGELISIIADFFTYCTF